MSQAVFAKVTRRLLATYGRPNVPDADALFDEFVNALGGFRESILTDAMDIVIREHRYQNWPTVGDVVARCHDVAARHQAQRDLEIKRREEAEASKEIPVVSPEAKKVVADVVASFTSKSLESNNDFAAIMRRCPAGGSINMKAPWGQEVRDASGAVVPIRERRKEQKDWMHG